MKKTLLLTLPLIAACMYSCDMADPENGGGTRTPQKLVESIKRADHDGIGGYEFAFKYDEDGRLIGYSINYDGTFAAQSTISYVGNTVIRESCSMYNPETESWTAVGETSYLLDENGYLIKTETKDMAIDGTEDEPYITTMTFSYEDGRVCSFLKEEPDYEYAEYTEFVWENDDIVRGTYNATTTTDDGITHFHSTDYEYTDIEDKFNIYVSEFTSDSPIWFETISGNNPFKFKGMYSQHLLHESYMGTYVYILDDEGFVTGFTDSNDNVYTISYVMI